MSGATTAPAIGTPLPSRSAPPVPTQASPSLSSVPRLLQRLVRGLGNMLLLVVVLAFAGLAVGPHVLGYRTMTMLTGSMAPVINPGDVTVAVQEPAADLAVAAAIASAATDTPASAGMVYFGEVGLSGEVRQVAQAELRLKEAQKLGFEGACLPRRVARGGRKPAAPDGLRLDEIGHLTDLVGGFAGKGTA